ncbi:uncharacterized protein LOC141726892 [Zonotrichia albicollis]|uniref:uncharacterized protein LOC141726892 n=1 Tax=Zonotrichia albicollis TaxID=44394 RepID=UPI003D812204
MKSGRHRPGQRCEHRPDPPRGRLPGRSCPPLHRPRCLRQPPLRPRRLRSQSRSRQKTLPIPCHACQPLPQRQSSLRFCRSQQQLPRRLLHPAQFSPRVFRVVSGLPLQGELGQGKRAPVSPSVEETGLASWLWPAGEPRLLHGRRDRRPLPLSQLPLQGQPREDPKNSGGKPRWVQERPRQLLPGAAGSQAAPSLWERLAGTAWGRQRLLPLALGSAEEAQSQSPAECTQAAAEPARAAAEQPGGVAAEDRCRLATVAQPRGAVFLSSQTQAWKPAEARAGAPGKAAAGRVWAVLAGLAGAVLAAPAGAVPPTLHHPEREGGEKDCSIWACSEDAEKKTSAPGETSPPRRDAGGLGSSRSSPKGSSPAGDGGNGASPFQLAIQGKATALRSKTGKSALNVRSCKGCRMKRETRMLTSCSEVFDTFFNKLDQKDLRDRDRTGPEGP